jgi:hypothetical protein
MTLFLVSLHRRSIPYHGPKTSAATCFARPPKTGGDIEHILGPVDPKLL